MELENVPFSFADRGEIPALSSPGARENARTKSIECAGTRTRLVEYSAGYEADHRSGKGHIVD